MPLRHRIKPGECIASIAYEHGFAPDALWDHPENQELRGLRGDPNVLMPDVDVVFIPDRRERVEQCATGRTHTFRRRGVPEVLRIRFLGMDQRPRAGVPYVLLLDGREYRGVTNADGILEERIPPNAARGTVRLGERNEADVAEDAEIIKIRLGYLAPITELLGAQGRLNNLGYTCAETGRLDEVTANALRAFQSDHDLELSGVPDEPTVALLHKRHVG